MTKKIKKQWTLWVSNEHACAILFAIWGLTFICMTFTPMIVYLCMVGRRPFPRSSLCSCFPRCRFHRIWRQTFSLFYFCSLFQLNYMFLKFESIWLDNSFLSSSTKITLRLYLCKTCLAKSRKENVPYLLVHTEQCMSSTLSTCKFLKFYVITQCKAFLGTSL